MDQKKAGIILSYTSEVIKILSGLIYTPIMLRLLGKSEYGLYQLVHSVIAYLGLLSLGFGSSYFRFYSRYKAKRDEHGIATLNGMFMVIFCVISVICLLCGSIMLGSIHAIFGSGLTKAEYDTAKILMMFMIFNMALTFPNSVFECFITAHEEFVFQKILLILKNLLNPFLTLPLLIVGYGSISMVCVTSCLTVAGMIFNICFCYKKLHIKFSFSGFDFVLLKEMWVFTFFIFLNQIIDQMNWSIDRFLLGRISGTTAVAIYGVGGQINGMYLQFSTAISNVFVPRVNRIVAEADDNGELMRLFTKVGRVQFVVMALILTGFLFFGYPFIRFWAGNEYEEAYFVTLFLIAPVTVPLIQNLGIEIQRAKNKHKARSVVYLGIAVVNVFISIPLIKVLGPVGAAMGTAISLIAGNILFMNWYYHKRMGLDMIGFWKSILGFIPALILPCIAGIAFIHFVSADNGVVLGMGMVGYIMIYAVSMWHMGMNSEERQVIMNFLKKAVRRKDG